MESELVLANRAAKKSVLYNQMAGKRSSEEAIANCLFIIYLLFFTNLLSEKINENMHICLLTLLLVSDSR